MIQPLRATREVWRLDWFDVDVPVQFGSMFILPTCLYVVHRYTRMLIGHEFVRELDHRRVELFVHRLFQERGAPDELLIPEFEEWDGSDSSLWQGLSREYGCEINLVDINTVQNDARGKENIEAQLGSLVASSAENVLATQGNSTVAQGLARAVKQMRSHDKKRALLVKALELKEDLPEALVELADLDLQEGRLEAAEEGFSRAADAAAPFHIQGQPSYFIRAQHGRFLATWQKGELANAIAIGEELLFANPADHPGIRFLLPLLLLLSNQLEQANEFFAWYGQNYPNDLEDPGLNFGWALTHFEFDEDQLAIAKYQGGMVQNLYLAPLLLDLPEPPPDIWQYNERGDTNYALEFADSFGAIWEQNAAATRFLREVYVGMLPKLEQLLELRRRMAETQDNRYDANHRESWERLVAEEQALVASWRIGG
jgi:tetratricopeptide (TPR) repeat protein